MKIYNFYQELLTSEDVKKLCDDNNVILIQDFYPYNPGSIRKFFRKLATNPKYQLIKRKQYHEVIGIMRVK